MQKRGTIMPDVDERRLHARKDPDHLAFIYISDDSAAACALYIDLLQHAVFDDGDAGLLGRDVYKYFFTHSLSINSLYMNIATEITEYTEIEKEKVFTL
jgi:hypothetical protein